MKHFRYKQIYRGKKTIQIKKNDSFFLFFVTESFRHQYKSKYYILQYELIKSSKIHC